MGIYRTMQQDSLIVLGDCILLNVFTIHEQREYLSYQHLSYLSKRGRFSHSSSNSLLYYFPFLFWKDNKYTKSIRKTMRKFLISLPIFFVFSFSLHLQQTKKEYKTYWKNDEQISHLFFNFPFVYLIPTNILKLKTIQKQD